MAYTPINDNEIDVGDALKKELFDKIQNNLDDHETRINNFEAGTGKIPIFLERITISKHGDTLSKVMSFISNQAMNVTSCYIQIEAKAINVGYSFNGQLQIDIKKSTTGKLFDADLVSIFTTKPSLTYGTDADYSRSTNQVFDTNTSLNAGDILVLDITAIPNYLNSGLPIDRNSLPYVYDLNFMINCFGEG